MATGLQGPGAVMAPADNPGAGDLEWAKVAGVPPTNPLVGGPGWTAGFGGIDVDRGRSRIVTQYADPMGAGPQMGPGMAVVDDWRDLFNWKGSPAPWLLLASLAILGLMQLRINARVGRRRGASAAVAIG